MNGFDITLDTEGESVNAVAATLRLPAGAKPDQIYIGRSVILFWLEKPTYHRESNTISFAGLSPGGFKGTVPVFTITGLESGEAAQIAFSEVTALKNDGRGTPAVVTLSVAEARLSADLIAPDAFRPVVAKSAGSFAGRPFVSFVAQDKGKGIDHYEYAVSFLVPPPASFYHPAVSPLVLSRGEEFGNIYIRAVDLSGNVRVASVAGPFYHASIAIGAILIVGLIALWHKKQWSRRRSS